MKYKRSEAKTYTKANVRGVWGGLLTPFTLKYEIDEEAFQFDIRWRSDMIELGGMYVNALQGESLLVVLAIVSLRLM